MAWGKDYALTCTPCLFFVISFSHNSHSRVGFKQIHKNDTFSHFGKTLSNRLLAQRWAFTPLFWCFPLTEVFQFFQKVSKMKQNKPP